MILRGHGTRRILRAARMAAAAKPIYAAQAGTDCSIASLLINCPTRDVRFTPNSGHWNSVVECPLCAKSRHYALQQSCLPLLQELANFRQQLAGTEGFRHVVIAASRPRLLLFAAERVRSDSNDRDRAQRWIGFNAARGCITVHDGQLDVHQNEIGPLLC